MQSFIKHFVRDGSGAWVCVERAEFSLAEWANPSNSRARFTPGTILMEIDLATLLDEEYDRGLQSELDARHPPAV